MSRTLADTRWRMVLVCLVSVATVIVLGYIAGLPLIYNYFLARCALAACTTTSFPGTLQALITEGVSGPVYATWRVILASVMALSLVTMTTIVVWRKPNDRMAVWVSMVLLIYVLTRQGPLGAFTSEHLSLPWWYALDWVGGAAHVGIYLIAFTFPTGCFVPRWTRFLVLPCILHVLGWRLPQHWVIWTGNWPVALLVAVEVGLFLFALGAQVYRYKIVSDPIERQQTRWVILGVTLGGGCSIALDFWNRFGPPSLTAPGSFGMVMAHLVFSLAWLLVPVCVGIAVMRYRLWNIDPIVNRTLVYGILTTSVIGFYVLVVGVLGSLLRGEGDFVLSLITTGIVAVLFQPLRERVQRGVNRLLYGERDEPYAVISRLGQRLETTLAPTAVLPVIVQTVSEALKLPYVAIAVDHNGRCAAAASVGLPTAEPLVLPLVHQTETIGQLILATRSPGERWSPNDRRLLDDLARQAGIAANAVRLHASTVQLAADLQRSREQLVTAREEERRRLRRDLHDGLGPSIAAQTMKVGTARYLLERDVGAAQSLLQELETDLVDVLADVRRVVYNLRPPALDQLGLLGAIRTATAISSAGSNARVVQTTVTAPEQLPVLSAAVEVAAYRIVTEAFTNVVRHAQARFCHITIAVGGTEAAPTLELRIGDDGGGIPADRRSGVGLQAMRERAAELGGICTITPQPEGGTMVHATIPFTPMG